jgi:hypothetical protein
VALLGDNIDTINKQKETLIAASKEADLEVNVSLPEYRSKSGHRDSKRVV